MNQHVQSFLDSFKFSKEYWTSLFIEFMGVSIIFLILTIYSLLIEARTLAITGGMPIEQLKLSLLQSTPDVAQAFATNVQIWMILLVAGSIIITLFSLFLFSYIQALVWNILIHRKILWRKLHLRWNGITLLLLIFLGLYLAVYAFIRLLVNSFLDTIGEPGYVMITSFINGIFIYAFLLFVFLVYYSFVRKNKVWESIGDTFSVIKSHGVSLGVLYVAVIIVGVVLSFLSYYLQQWTQAYPPLLSIILPVLILILFYAWMRFYLLKTIQHSP